ncbi:MAG: hypothetical protein EU551_00120 [Promethearchaeota archaeon]|nr:MAG: hypothetical protein EU551_00120 [Candidatus Lokiarchaeota archaeon]
MKKEGLISLNTKISRRIFDLFQNTFRSYYNTKNEDNNEEKEELDQLLDYILFNDIPPIYYTSNYAELITILNLFIYNANEEAIKAIDLILSTPEIRRFYSNNEIDDEIIDILEKTDLDYMLLRVLEKNNYKVQEFSDIARDLKI